MTLLFGFLMLFAGYAMHPYVQPYVQPWIDKFTSSKDETPPSDEGK